MDISSYVTVLPIVIICYLVGIGWGGGGGGGGAGEGGGRGRIRCSACYVCNEKLSSGRYYYGNLSWNYVRICIYGDQSGV